MDILIQADGVTLAEDLREAVEEKIGRVQQYEPRALRARVRLRKVSAHPSPRQYLVRVIYEIPGNNLTAEQYGEDIISALDIVAEKIERRLRKRKTSRISKRQHKPGRSKELEKS